MPSNPSRFKEIGSAAPVERVSWNEAHDFCGRLSELWEEKSLGHRYRLPTEAEWEFACRAGTTTYYFGDDEVGLSDYAWFDANSDYKTHHVGLKKPNSFGLYDVHGNVWEWCQDGYDAAYYRRSPVDDPRGPMNETLLRVIRGGSWSYTAVACRSAYRNALDRWYHADTCGFRVVLVPPGQ
jgi:formylglycine-generating enzyme required for sulfatase activity